MKRIWLTTLFVLLTGTVEAATIVSDNWDTWGTFSCTTHACADGYIQSPWSSFGLTDADGLTIGVNASYGRSGKGWRTTYVGGFKGAGINLGTIAGQDETYVRFYMKFGSNAHWSPAMSNGMKIFRWGLAPELFRLEFGSSYDGLYIISDSAGGIYPRDHGTTYTWADFNNGVNDASYGGNVWRCIEVHGKFGASVGTDTVDIWVDGVQIMHATNQQLRSSTGNHMTTFNLGDNAEYLIGDLYFDDFIISTTYNGPTGGTTPTTSVVGVSITGGSVR